MLKYGLLNYASFPKNIHKSNVTDIVKTHVYGRDNSWIRCHSQEEIEENLNSIIWSKISTLKYPFDIIKVTKGKLRLEIKNKLAMIFQLFYLPEENDFLLTINEFAVLCLNDSFVVDEDNFA